MFRPTIVGIMILSSFLFPIVNAVARTQTLNNLCEAFGDCCYVMRQVAECSVSQVEVACSIFPSITLSWVYHPVGFLQWIFVNIPCRNLAALNLRVLRGDRELTQSANDSSWPVGLLASCQAAYGSSQSSSPAPSGTLSDRLRSAADSCSKRQAIWKRKNKGCYNIPTRDANKPITGFTAHNQHDRSQIIINITNHSS